MLERDDQSNEFVNMKPISKPPSMFTYNGMGATVYGRRDFDPQSQTYIKTHVICLLFVPFLAIGSYRVQDCETGGWYFLGKVPMSGLAKVYNYLMIAAVLAFAGTLYMDSYKNSPEYIAEQNIAKADTLLKEGKKIEAAKAYIKMIQSQSYHKDRAIKAIVPLCKDLIESSKTAKEVLVATKVIHTANRAHKNTYPNIVEVLQQKSMKLAGAKEYQDALAVLKEFLRLKPDDKKSQSMRIFLLKKLIEKNPEDHKSAIELAEAYDKQGELKNAVAVLKGREAHIQNTYAAAILGKFYYKNGDLDKAIDLLQPYLDKEIKAMTALEKRYNNTYDSEYERTAQNLAQGLGVRNRDLTKAEIEKIRAATDKALANNQKLEKIRQQLVKKTEIVPVALDLGAARLSRAQSIPPGPKRNAELVEVEKQFLSIKSFAGSSNDYKYFLGQVYYWLGKDKEASKVFNDLEKGNLKNGQVLLAMARVLREVGELKEARRLSEYVFSSNKDKQIKTDAAMFRALVYTDQDDEVEWLKKCPIKNESVNVHLNSALGTKALDEGNVVEAEKYFREVIAAYSKMPKGSSVYNNMGLAYQRLYQISSKLDDYRKGSQMLNESLRLEPDNSILLHNTSNSLKTLALLNALDGKADPKLFLYGLTEITSFIHNNKWQKESFEKSYRDSDYKKSIEYLDKSVLLSPKNVGMLLSSVAVHSDDKNIDKLKELQNRIAASKIDMQSLITDYKESMTAESRKEDLEYTKKSLDRRVKWLAKSDVQSDKLAKVVAAVKRLNIETSLHYTYGRPLDFASAELEAESLVKELPCFSTRDALGDVLRYKLINELVQKDPEFNKHRTYCLDSIKPWNTFLLYLYINPSKSKLLAPSKKLQKLLSFMKDFYKDYELDAVQDLVFFEIFDKGYAVKKKNSFLAKEYNVLALNISFQAMPYMPGVVMNKYWLEVIKGDSAKAAEVMTVGYKTGVKMGFERIAKPK